MAEEQNKDDRPFVERWLEEQKEWQKTMLTYVDTMANNEDFLVHLGNAMRGSLLAGKPYPGTSAPSGTSAEASEDAAASQEQLDRILFTLHEMQGQLNDLQLTVDRLVADKAPAVPSDSPAPPLQFGTPDPDDGTVSHGGAPAAVSPAPGSDRERDNG